MIKDEIFNILSKNYALRKVISDKVVSENEKRNEVGTRIVNVERWSDRKRVPSWYKKSFIQLIENELQISKTEIEC